MWQKPSLKRFNRIRSDERSTVLAEENGIHYQREMEINGHASDSFDDFPFPQRASLCRRWRDIADNRPNLRGDQIGGKIFDSVHSVCVLHGDQGDHRLAINTELMECFKIGLNPRSAARVRTGNRQRNRCGPCHPLQSGGSAGVSASPAFRLASAPSLIPYHEKRSPILLMRLFIFSLGVVAWAAPQTPPSEVTFHKDVEPILQKHCQECHRPGEIAPFSLLSYKDSRPWAKAIRENVVSKKMPPWLADPQYGHFANDRSLSKQEIDTLAAWVDGGAKEGDSKDAPKPRAFVEGWNIPQPDLVLSVSQPFHVPAKAEVPYQYLVLPTQFTEDKWLAMADVHCVGRTKY